MVSLKAGLSGHVVTAQNGAVHMHAEGSGTKHFKGPGGVECTLLNWQGSRKEKLILDLALSS